MLDSGEWFLPSTARRLLTTDKKEDIMSRRLGWVRVLVAVLLLVLCTAFAVAVRAGEIRGASVAAQRDGSLAPVTGEAAGQTQLHQTTGGMLASLPLYFIENHGQLDPQVDYYVQGNHKTLYFTPQGVTFALHGAGNPQGGELSNEFPRVPSARWAVKLEFVGANPHVQPAGVDETGALISYFKGRREEWVTGARAYSGVVYRDLWPGIDLEYYGLVNKLKYQFVVRPGADSSQIRLAYSGATEVAVDQSGGLQVSTPLGGFEDGAPYAYQQDEGGEKAEVQVSYELEETLGASETPSVYYSFRLGDYDPSRPLILDPTVLNYCGYLGGLRDEVAQGIAVDSSGHAYITGFTLSDQTSFPVTVGPDQEHNGDEDAFVAKVRADGSGLVYCGYIGGSEYDNSFGIAVDSSGHAYIAGMTRSDETQGFPATVGPHLVHSGERDVFVAKVKADGTDLLYCGYIGGSGLESVGGIAVDSSGSAYLAGSTNSAPGDGFPVLVGPDLTYGGTGDAFVAKVEADGSGLVYCGYIGGSEYDAGLGIAVDGLGSAHAVGRTNSNPAGGFPVAVGPDLTHNGAEDGFVAKVQADGTGLDHCGYIGGSSYDSCWAVALDSSGNAYVSGSTRSDELSFPATVGPDVTYNGGEFLDAFVAKVHAGGTVLDYCGYIGGSEEEIGQAIAVDGEGRAYVTGLTHSDEATFPVRDGPDLSYNGDRDAYVARVRADGGALDYCGYIGGLSSEEGEGIAVDGAGNAYVAGSTSSSEAEGFPVAIGPDLSYGGPRDGFVARVGENRAPTLGVVMPASGSSKTGVTVYFTTTWKDADGREDLKQCYFHIGASPSLVNNVTLMYNARKNKLWLLDDTGTTWTGGFAPGSANILENSQAKVYCVTSRVHGEGDTLAVTWAIEFDKAYTGDKKTGLKCKDAHKAKAKGKWKGTWLIE
jgi:hypothetical protein